MPKTCIRFHDSGLVGYRLGFRNLRISTHLYIVNTPFLLYQDKFDFRIPRIRYDRNPEKDKKIGPGVKNSVFNPSRKDLKILDHKITGFENES